MKERSEALARVLSVVLDVDMRAISLVAQDLGERKRRYFSGDRREILGVEARYEHGESLVKVGASGPLP